MAASKRPSEPGVAAPFARRGKLRTIWRITSWGGAAALAVGAVLLISQTEVGGERLQLALTRTREPEPQAVAPMPPRVVVDAEETRKLADAVRKLVADRDRLKERLASLERNFDDMTGSINTVMQANAAAQSVKDSPKEKIASAMPATASVPPPLPAQPEVKRASPSPVASAPPPAPVVDPRQTEIVPLPPVAPFRVASLAPAKIEYGVDLGIAASIEDTRDKWTRVKANFGSLLAGLRPVAAPRQRPTGTEFRLVVGPFPTLAEAARLCARFNSARAACRTAKFTGEDLAQR
jgi:SPOR domain